MFFFFPSLARLPSVYLFLDGAHCSSFISPALCDDNVEKYRSSERSRLQKYGFFDWMAFFLKAFPSTARCSLSYFLTVLYKIHIFFSCFTVCVYISVGLSVWRLQCATNKNKTNVSINLNLMFISFFLSVQRFAEVITTYKQAINHPLFSLLF